MKINLPSIKDENIKLRFENAEDMVKKAEVLAEKIYEDVLNSL